ncbi:MAG: hypothetical protein ACOX4P_06925 [Anaerovoracaceae bacterium]|jgi:phosphate starvation-inducible membrane PsiE
MAFGIFIAVASIIGIIYGKIKKNKPLAILSVVALMMIIAIWVYFYYNPY